MNRRDFLCGMSAVLATKTAPFVCTAAGVLMPVRKIITLPRVTHIGFDNHFFVLHPGWKAVVYDAREMLEDSVIWQNELPRYSDL